jgi:hypothetical protein
VLERLNIPFMSVRRACSSSRTATQLDCSVPMYIWYRTNIHMMCRSTSTSRFTSVPPPVPMPPFAKCQTMILVPIDPGRTQTPLPYPLVERNKNLSSIRIDPRCLRWPRFLPYPWASLLRTPERAIRFDYKVRVSSEEPRFY